MRTAGLAVEPILQQWPLQTLQGGRGLLVGILRLPACLGHSSNL